MENEADIDIKLRNIIKDPTFSDRENIEKARQNLLALDTESKLTIVPNQVSKGELEVYAEILFEPRAELDGKSAYEYFNRIIIGHGEGPVEIDERRFKGNENLAADLPKTVGELKEKVAKAGEKVLTIVCGSEEKDKVTLSSAIRDYLVKEKQIS